METKTINNSTPPPEIVTRAVNDTEIVTGEEFKTMVNDKLWDWPDKECITFQQAMLMIPEPSNTINRLDYTSITNWLWSSTSEHSGLLILELTLDSAMLAILTLSVSSDSSCTINLPTANSETHFIGMWKGYPDYSVNFNGPLNRAVFKFTTYKIRSNSAEHVAAKEHIFTSYGGGGMIEANEDPYGANKYLTIGTLSAY